MNRMSLEQFVKKYNGAAVDFDKKYGAQCVDLFNFYNAEVVGAPWIGTPVTNGARDLFEVSSSARSAYYDVLSGVQDFQPGDVLVYGQPHGRYVENGVVYYLGHVNIYIGSGQVIEQNGKIAQKTTVREVFTSGLLGVLRPKSFRIETSPQNVPDQTQNKNKHTILAGDTFWGLEETNGWEHGILQRLNPELDPRLLRIGSQIIIPGEPAPESSAAETYYKIRAGDTFWGLEDAWQLPHGTLQQLNPGVEPRALAIGQRIRRS